MDNLYRHYIHKLVLTYIFEKKIGSTSSLNTSMFKHFQYNQKKVNTFDYNLDIQDPSNIKTQILKFVHDYLEENNNYILYNMIL